jgi:uncharacterized delta-60 repeat protein
VFSLALQADGKVLVLGSFTTLAGEACTNFGRLNSDGTLDTSFNPGVGGNSYPQVCCLALQADGQIIVGGSFNTLSGQSRTNIGRLNTDGSVDAGFNPGANDTVVSLAVQADGKILAGGDFTSLGGFARTHLGRLNTDGTVETSFDPRVERDSYPGVYTLAVQADGKILVGGCFETLGGEPRQNLGRLNADGSVDVGFNPGVDHPADCIELQADGRILVGGTFTTLGGVACTNLGRLNVDGSLDTTFKPEVDRGVSSLAVQADRKIVLGGSLETLSGHPHNKIGRLNADGSVDTTFNPGAEGASYNSVESLAIQADGKILVGGCFTTLAGAASWSIGRLNNTDPATQSLVLDASAITWVRGGTSPEILCSTFEMTTNGGASWVALGNGTRIADGWKLGKPNLPVGSTIRARGYIGAAGSSWIAESCFGAPLRPQIVSNSLSPWFRRDSFGFNLAGVAGTFVVIEGSTDLENWTPMQTNFLNTSVGTFHDPTVTNYPSRYYRLRVEHAEQDTGRAGLAEAADQE